MTGPRKRRLIARLASLQAPGARVQRLIGDCRIGTVKSGSSWEAIVSHVASSRRCLVPRRLSAIVGGSAERKVSDVFQTVGTPGKRDHQSRYKGAVFTIRYVLTRRAGPP